MPLAAANQANPVRIPRAEMRAARRKRALVMAEKFRAGMSMKEIGDYYGITRERVRQLLTQELGLTAKDGGHARRAAAKRKATKARRELRFIQRYGMTEERFNAIQGGLGASKGGPYMAFTRQQANAKVRGIGWNLTFAEWWGIWQESGKWEERGRKGYVMARHGDAGPYAMGNVKIIPATENQSEYIRRYWKQVRSGDRPRPKPVKHRYHELAIGQTMTVEATTKRPEYARNHALATARAHGMKIKTRLRGRALTVTRIA